MAIQPTALAYLEKGWSVIPLQHREKSPRGEWGEFYSRRPTAEEINRWPTSSNIGIVTGAISGLAAVDFDPDKGGTQEVKDRYLADHPTGLISQTGSGGWHLFYAIPPHTEVRCRTAMMPGVDVRAEGGFVVGPPSIHPNGEHYKWLSEGEPGPLPPTLSSALSNKTANPPGWLEKAFSGVAEGGRDATATKLAGYLAGKGVSKSVAVSILTAWNANNTPPLPVSDIEKCVVSIFLKEQRAEKLRPPISPEEKTGFELVRFGEYMAKFAEGQAEWQVQDWLPRSSVGMVISPPGTYKTWAMLDLCVSVASGLPFLGQFEVHDKGPVFLVQQEDYNGALVSRLSVIAHAKSNIAPEWEDDSGEIFEISEAPDYEIYHHTDRRLRFDDADAIKSFSAQVERIKPKLVVLDPLYSAASLDDFMAKAAQDMFVFKDLRDKFGTSFLICHHTNKSADTRDRQRAWGSQFLNAFLETGWQFSTKPDNKSIGVRRHFKSAAEPKDIVVKFDIGTNTDNYKYNVSIEEQDFESEEEEDEEEGGVNKDAFGPKPRTGGRPSLKVDQKILKHFSENKAEKYNITQMMDVCKAGHSTVIRALRSLATQGLILRVWEKNETFFKHRS